MADEEKLSLSCETFAMLKSTFFMSSFPSYIIFGKTIRNVKYSNGEHFKIKFSDAYKLMVNLLYIGSFMQSSDIYSSRGLIIENEDDNENYFWHGITLQRNDEQIKAVKFGIETRSESNIVFESLFTVEELNNFIYLFKRCLLSCLCLKDCEEQMITTIAISESCENIVLAKSNLTLAKNMIKLFFRSSNFSEPENLSYLIELIAYYNDIILVTKQLTALYTPVDDNSAIILALQ